VPEYEKISEVLQMKAKKFTHFCEFDVISEEHNLVACFICGNELGVAV